MDLAKLEDVRYEVERGLAWITINRPERFNAFRARTVDELIRCFKAAWSDTAVGVVALTGAGEQAFCAGGDQKQRNETGDYGPSETGVFEVETLHRVIRDLPKPVIAAVNGVAVGGGHVLHVLCDLTIAAVARALRPGRPARRLVRRRLRQRLPGAHSGREARARGLVPVPAVRRGDHGALGARERGRAEGGAARRGAPLGGRDARQEPHRAEGPEAQLQRRQRGDRRHRHARVRLARPVRADRRGARGLSPPSTRSARPTSRSTGASRSRVAPGVRGVEAGAHRAPRAARTARACRGA